MTNLYPIHDDFEIDVDQVRKYMKQRDDLLKACHSLFDSIDESQGVFIPVPFAEKLIKLRGVVAATEDKAAATGEQE